MKGSVKEISRELKGWKWKPVNAVEREESAHPHGSAGRSGSPGWNEKMGMTCYLWTEEKGIVFCLLYLLYKLTENNVNKPFVLVYFHKDVTLCILALLPKVWSKTILIKLGWHYLMGRVQNCCWAVPTRLASLGLWWHSSLEGGCCWSGGDDRSHTQLW